MNPKAPRPATPLPWAQFGDGSVRKPGGLFADQPGVQGATVCRPEDEDDAAYIAHACNAYPRLVEAARSYANTCTLMALRDSADPEMLKGWREAQQNVSALLAELGE